MINQRSGTKIIYPNLYKGLGLKLENLTKYNTPLVGFDRKMVVLKGQISLLVLTEGKKVMVNFIVINTFSPYMTILGRPWIHAMGEIRYT